MDRCEFIKKIISAGTLSGLLLYTEDHSQAEEKLENKPDHEQQFTGAWVNSLLNHMQTDMDEKELTGLLEACGRDCARRGAVNIARDSEGDIKKMLATLSEHLGKENAYMQGDVACLKYSTCLCPVVAKYKGEISPFYCNCSKGWVLEMFETAAKKPVRAELLKSIKRGDDCCEFRIYLQDS